ncbi:MAG: hypothetical protein QXN44_05945 [Candidatus Caldarchaeum sp.]
MKAIYFDGVRLSLVKDHRPKLKMRPLCKMFSLESAGRTSRS